MSKPNSVEHIDVRYVANLARMELSENEAQLLQGQLEQILDYVQRIRELDVSGIEPTSHARPLSNIFREDEIRSGLEREPVLANAPQASGDLFVVPQIIE